MPAKVLDSFALIAYASAYLKAHPPAAFGCALLNSWPMGFYHPATIVKDLQLLLIPTGTASVSGVLRDHVTGDPVAGATVRLMFSSDGYYMSQFPTTTTGSDGAYSFTNLPPSDVMPAPTLTFEKPGAYFTKNLTVRFGSEAVVRNTTVIPVVSGTGSIAGTVKLSNDAEFGWGSISLMTAGWRPVGNPVQLSSSGSGEASYSFGNLPTGAYQLSVFTEGSASKIVSANVVDGEITPLDITVAAYETGDAVVSGTVIDVRTGEPVAGAPVFLAPEYGQNSASQNTYSDADGFWEFTGVADGSYYANVSVWQVSPPDGTLGWEGYTPQAQIEVVDGVSVTDQEFEVRSFVGGDAVLDGRIRDATSHLPVADATVSLVRSASGTPLGEWQTDESGTFAVEGLSNGDYYVSVAKDGYKTGNASVLVVDGHASIVIPITRLNQSSGTFAEGEISFTVFDSDGRRIDDATIDGSQPALDADNWVSFNEPVDEQGELTVRDLLAGHWVIWVNAQSPSGSRIFAPVHVDISESNPTAEIEIHESVGSRITGQVDLNGFAANELVIAAYDEAGLWFSTGTVLEDGTYEISDLPEGDFVLALQGGEMGSWGSSISTSEIWATPVYSTGGGTGQTPDLDQADAIELTGGQLVTGVDFTAVAGGSARATVALHSAGANAPLPASRCIEMTVYRLTGGEWSAYAPGWKYSCGDFPLLAGGLPSGQYKFEIADTLSGSTAFRTTYNGDALTLAAAPAVTVVAGELKNLGTITVRVPEPDEGSLEALDLDFLASDPDFDLSAYEDQVTADGDPTAGEETEVEVGEEFAGQWVNVSLNSTPVVVGEAWHQVAADGTVTVTLPSDLDGSHRLAVGDSSGQLIGWTAVEIAEGTGSTSGGSTGGSTAGGTSGGSTSAKPAAKPSGGSSAPAAEPIATPTASPTPKPVATEEPEAAPETVPEPTASDSPQGDGGWILWVVGGGLVVLVGAAAVLIFRRRLA